MAARQYGIPKSTLSLYVSGKLQIGARWGPASILSPEKEQRIVDYAVHMGEIGYGRTHEQILDIVAAIVSKDGRPNPFVNGRRGCKWWSLFRKRHPEITLCTPEKLQLARAKCCTPEILGAWFKEFGEFLEAQSLLNKAECIWNADEASFPLCAMSGKVISIRNLKNVYAITADTKEQITALCAISAAGDALPPMHIFPGTRFKYNPMLNCVDGACFGHSPTGWISTELFYGWIANHFAKRVSVRPVVLLVDGHSSHIDIHTSKFCRENNILLYCLPPHSSHLTQPLDVSFFKPLKSAWGKACNSYCATNPGFQVTKHKFAQVFHEVWLSSTRMSTIENGFRESGICPFKPEVVLKSKLPPSLQFSSEKSTLEAQKSTAAQSTQRNPVTVFESLIGEEKVKKFEERFEEKYDIESDELYSVWVKMKSLSIQDDQPSVSHTTSRDTISDSSLAANQKSISNQPPATRNQQPSAPKASVLDSILVYPSVPESSKSISKASLPKHLSGEQFIQYLQEKKDKKEQTELEKAERKTERERKKKEREHKKELQEERRKKQLQREKKKLEAESKKQERINASRGRGSRGRGCGRGSRGRGRGRGSRGRGQGSRGQGGDRGTFQGQCHSQDLLNSDDSSDTDGDGKAAVTSSSTSRSEDCEEPGGETSTSSDECNCVVCDTHDDGRWIQCDVYDSWCHFKCANIPDNLSTESLDWQCPKCVC